MFGSFPLGLCYNAGFHMLNVPNNIDYHFTFSDQRRMRSTQEQLQQLQATTDEDTLCVAERRDYSAKLLVRPDGGLSLQFEQPKQFYKERLKELRHFLDGHAEARASGLQIALSEYQPVWWDDSEEVPDELPCWISTAECIRETKKQCALLESKPLCNLQETGEIISCLS